MSIACPHCGEAAQSGQFCDSCGKKLEKTCQACSAANRPNARFCANCGTPFERTDRPPAKPEADGDGAQQKQVTVLFADICGSTELVSRMDAEDANHALGSVIRVVVEALVRFGGVVNRQMGDGVMALFGAPVAIEDHAARACFAALAALDAVNQMGDRALPIRVGVSSGPVILRRTGRDDEDYDVAGVTAHIAARLEQQAEPGTVLLSPQTANLVKGIAEVKSVGKMSLKGIAEPLPVFRLLSATDRPSWIVRSGAKALSTFVGREEELAQLSAALERASAGHAQAIALVADAGMGKSRLLHEFLEGLPQGAWHAIRVETTAQSTAFPYFLITALLRRSWAVRRTIRPPKLPPACRQCWPRSASTPTSIRRPFSPTWTGKSKMSRSARSTMHSAVFGSCAHCVRSCSAMPTYTLSFWSLKTITGSTHPASRS